MFVDQSIEGHPVSPAGGEVVDVDVWISEREDSESELKIRTTEPKRSLKG